MGIKRIITGRNHLLTGYFRSNHCNKEEDLNANKYMSDFRSKGKKYIDRF